MSEIGINGLKSRDRQGCAPSGGSRGESVSCLFKLQVVLAFSGLWLHHLNRFLACKTSRSELPLTEGGELDWRRPGAGFRTSSI